MTAAPPLTRYRLLDLSRQLPGPFCSTVLGDLGMDVLVITSPKDPFGTGIGFLTLSRVKVTPDLQLARVLYTVIGDEKQRKETQKALDRALPFLRRQIASRMRLRRVPELQFQRPGAEIELSRVDARARGIADGDSVVVRSNGTSVQLRAKVGSRRAISRIDP